MQKLILKSEKEYDVKEERLLILLKERKIKLNLNNNGYSNDLNNSKIYYIEIIKRLIKKILTKF